jgi:excisionase family DNA binding protein
VEEAFSSGRRRKEMESKSGGTSNSRSSSLARNGPLLDIDAVAEALGVTSRHVQRLVSERRIPYLKIGRFVRFDPAELDVWLDKLRVAPERYAPRDYAPWR